MPQSSWNSTYVADEKLKINWFEAGLNPGLKEKMSVWHYTSYEDMYNIVVNVERVTKENNKFYNEQQEMKTTGEQRDNHSFQQLHKRPRENFSNHPYSDNRPHFSNSRQCLWETWALRTRMKHC